MRPLLLQAASLGFLGAARPTLGPQWVVQGAMATSVPAWGRRGCPRANYAPAIGRDFVAQCFTFLLQSLILLEILIAKLYN